MKKRLTELVLILVKAGFDPNDMSLIFQRMQDKYQREDSEQFSYLMTHPLPSERRQI